MALAQENAARGGKQPSAPVFVDVIEVTCDNAYPAAGWPLDLATAVDAAGDLILPYGTTILEVVVISPHAATGYVLSYDKTAKLLKAWECAAATNPMTDMSTAAALNGEVVTLLVYSY